MANTYFKQSTKFLMTRDLSGTNGFGILPTFDVLGCSFTANAAQTFTTPSNYPNWIAIFSYTPGTAFFVDFSGATATVPGGTVGSLSVVLNPAARAVTAGQTFSVITSDATSPFLIVEFQIINPYVN